MTACPETRPELTSFALSVSPFFNPKGPVSPYLIQKNRVKLRQIRLKSGKCHQRFSKEKTPENRNFPGFLSISDIKSALGELGSATGGLQTVLKFFDCHFPLIFWAFLPFRFSVVLFLNHKNRCFLLLRFKLQSLKNVSHNTIILKQSNSKTLFPSIF